MASLTPFRFSWTPAEETVKTTDLTLPATTKHSSGGGWVQRSLARNARERQKETKGRSRRNILHRCGSGTWGDTSGWSVSVVLPNGN